MADSVDEVKQLISMLREASFEVAREELAELQAFANEHGFEGNLELWDVSYWSERLKEEKLQFSEEELRPYFSFENVLDALFHLLSRLFGIRIQEASSEVDRWHEDVRFYKIYDEVSGEHIASFFLDPFSRPEEKRGGAWMDECLGKSKVFGTKPVAYLICNGAKPVGGEPSLMSFREVETLFHETGHGLQHMLTTVTERDAAGIQGVEWDCVELPSQFLENFVVEKETVGFYKHFQTGEVLPDELLQKLKAQKNFHSGMQTLRQLFFAELDMRLHHEYDPFNPAAQTPFDLQREVARDYTVIPPLDSDRFLCSFMHIFGGGYAAGYYSYKYAEVLAADAFGAFEEAGLDKEETIRGLGRRFRDTVLSLGGGTHPKEVFRQFRGRDPSPVALLRQSGLLKEGEDK
jgi:oligopeptidase A